MLGTLNGALEVRGISLPPKAMSAVAVGTNAVRDGLPVLTGIEVRYTLSIPAQCRDKVERALARHQQKCPTAETLKGAVQVSWTASIEEVGDPV